MDDLLAEFLVELLAEVCVISIHRGRGVRWNTCVICCIHLQRKGSAIVYMCYVLYPFTEDEECDSIRVCLCCIHS